ncbi:MAG TPA: hypothetical protein VGM90_12430 [Kofleriaceae bacterium]|jgi:hypothetical protein
MRSKIALAPFIVLAVSQMGATDGGGCGEGGQVTRDPGFDLWCGDTLCSWKIDRGSIAKIGTWHADDPGVAFLGADSAISQVSPVNSTDGHCIKFQLLSKVEGSAQIELRVDIGDDGTVDQTERFPVSDHWELLVYDIYMNRDYNGARFEIAKSGNGNAAIAQIDANIDPGACDGFSSALADPQGNGTVCDLNTQCESGMCNGMSHVPGLDNHTCQGCAPGVSGTCGATDTCGAVEPFSAVLDDVIHACVPAHSAKTGQRCYDDSQCANSTCVQGVCSTCRTAADCGAGDTCGTTFLYGPNVCAYKLGHRTTGQSCFDNADCASGACNGTPRYQCDDGRSCPGGDRTLCPPQSGFSLEPGPCTEVGIEGGTCT